MIAVFKARQWSQQFAQCLLLPLVAVNEAPQAFFASLALGSGQCAFTRLLFQCQLVHGQVPTITPIHQADFGFWVQAK